MVLFKNNSKTPFYLGEKKKINRNGELVINCL